MRFKLDEYLFSQHCAGRQAVLAFIRARLVNLLEIDLYGRLTVVGPARIRIR